MGGSDVHDMSYYGKCMIGGILSCGLTHMLVCPLDIVKCRKQVRIIFISNGLTDHNMRTSKISLIIIIFRYGRKTS